MDDSLDLLATGALQHEVATSATRSLARVARLFERASPELSLAQYRVLAAVGDGEERASRVAERLELGRPAVSAAVDALSRRGLIVREETPGDQRSFDLRVTAEGSTALAHADAAMVRVVEDLADATPDPVTTLEVLASLGPAVDAVYSARKTLPRTT